MARLDVTLSTLKKLFALSGNQCAFPDCAQPVVNEHGDLIGEVCHIEAANERGQRYNPDQSDEDRRAFENLLILCPTHHATTDNVEVYPVERMREIKREHEGRFVAAPFQISDDRASRLAEQANRRLREQIEGIAVSKLPRGAEVLVGRTKELGHLTRAWRDPKTHVVSIVAWGGVGKTALVVEWMTRLAVQDWPGVDRYFDWSFYSQGTREQGAASADLFIAKALEHFGDPDPQAGSPYDRGERLAKLVAERPSLLILDGLEPLQHGPGPVAGQLKDPALATLLKGLAQRPFAGLCVLTSREAVTDLKSFHGKTVAEWDLEHLSDEAGAELLHRAGACRAGVADIDPDDQELREASKEVRGHALTLELLGRYLRLAHGGDVRRRDRVRFQKADATTQGGHAFRVIAAYERWLKREEGQQEDTEARKTPSRSSVSSASSCARPLAVLRLLGLFDRPADPGCLRALRKPPVIEGLTEPLVDLDEEDWNIALTQLGELGLISLPSSFVLHPSSFSLDAHPLVREYFGRQLQKRNREAWRAAHRRLYEHLCETAEHQPDTLAGLQPLYQAVAHGCQAGLHAEARRDVYRDRILRGTGAGGFYSSSKLGAIGADLGAVACFFEQPWSRLSPNLSPADRAWLLSVAAFHLRALGRLAEAVEPMRAALEMGVEGEDWKNAGIRAGNLSELELTLGNVAAAVTDAEESVTFADRTHDAFEKQTDRVILADALHQAGRPEQAFELFREAEVMQADWQPEYSRLYSGAGFRYCDLLLAEAERAAWRVFLDCADSLVPKLRLGNHGSRSSASEEEGKQSFPEVRSQAGAWERGDAREQPPYDLGACVAACDEVAERAEGAQRAWREIFTNDPSLLDIALDHLTLARAALYRAILSESTLSDHRSSIINHHSTAAVDGLRASGQMDDLPRGLLTRAWLRFLQGDAPGAQADLDEAWEIAERGPMGLFQADVQLTRARLFRDKEALAEARRLIEKHGYRRREEELADVGRLQIED